MKAENNTRSSTASSSDLYQVPESMKKKFFLREMFFIVYHCCRLGLTIAIVVLMAETDTRSIVESEGFSRMQEVVEIWGKGLSALK